MRVPWVLLGAAIVGVLSCAKGSTAKFDDDDDDGSGGHAGGSTTTTTTTSTETTSTETTSTETTSTETTTTTTTTTTTGGSGGACYAGVENCSPMQPSSCGAGYACDVTCDEYMPDICWFDCFAPPNDVPVGGSCDAVNGPWCVPGAFCNNYVCAKFCCTNADCNGGTCTALGYIDTGTQQVDVMVCP